MQDEEGQILEAHSISAGLDYPGAGPEHAHLRDSGRARYVAVTDDEALAAFRRVARLEGIIPALETAHALAWVLARAPSGRRSTSSACPGAATRTSPRCWGSRRRRHEDPTAPHQRRRSGIADAFADARQARRADALPDGRLPDARGVARRSARRARRRAPTCSSWACPTPTRSPTAR